MRRRNVLLSLGLLVLFLGTATTLLIVLLKHQPTFYRTSTMPPSLERTQQSGEFISRSTNLTNSIYNLYSDWWEVFTTEQINAFLQEDFLQSWGGEERLPEGFHDLRVLIDDGKLLLGCRYGKGNWSVILSIEMKIWLVANEVNLIGVEVENLRAGALPISRQIILDYITEAARRSNIDVKWYHRNGNPVAILKLQANQVRPTIQIQRLELKAGKDGEAGKLIIVGRSTETHGRAN
ncbi:MAG: hypothetical protein K8T89_23715 [Planctomycetes bacterium]|nr:hypothetical protein [Planctomycetota bacterium]